MKSLNCACYSQATLKCMFYSIQKFKTWAPAYEIDELQCHFLLPAFPPHPQSNIQKSTMQGWKKNRTAVELEPSHLNKQILKKLDEDIIVGEASHSIKHSKFEVKSKFNLN